MGELRCWDPAREGIESCATTTTGMPACDVGSFGAACARARDGRLSRA